MRLERRIQQGESSIWRIGENNGDPFVPTLEKKKKKKTCLFAGKLKQEEIKLPFFIIKSFRNLYSKTLKDIVDTRTM